MRSESSSAAAGGVDNDSDYASGGGWVVSPIVYAIVFQFHRAAVRTWAEAVASWKPKRIVASHFPIPRGGDAKTSGASFLSAFDWAKSASASPAAYVDPNDMASLELVVRILRFIKALPPSDNDSQAT